MKKNKILIITSIICLLPIVYGLIVYDKLPDMIPSHFNFSGEVDGYTSKPLFVFGLPVFLCLLNIICNYTIKYDPKNTNQNKFMMSLPKYIIAFISFFMNMLVYYKVLYNDINISIFIPYFLGIMFIILGNYLPKCRQSYTIGIKLPWTLNSEVNWNKTHRLAGFIWVLSGIIIIVAKFIVGDNIYPFILFSLIILMVIIPTIYSFILYRNEL